VALGGSAFWLQLSCSAFRGSIHLIVTKIIFDYYAFGGSQSWAALIGEAGSFLPAHDIQKKIDER